MSFGDCAVVMVISLDEVGTPEEAAVNRRIVMYMEDNELIVLGI